MGGGYRSNLACVFAFALLAVMTGLLAHSPVVWAEDLTVCAQGAGAGECSNPNGLATDFENERLYVADQGNNRVDVFDFEGGTVEFVFAFGWGVDTGGSKFEICTSATACQTGLSGTGSGQFNAPRRIAVDNSPGSVAHHCVYVYDANLWIQKFCPSGEAVSFIKRTGKFSQSFNPLAVGPGGDLYLGDSASEKEPIVKKLNSNLEPIGECLLPHEDLLSGALAVDSAGAVHASFNHGGGIFRFEYLQPTCNEAAAPFPLTPNIGTNSLAVDGADIFYAAQAISRAKEGTFRTVAKFNSAGAISRRYGFGSLLDKTIPGVAPLATSVGDLFASEEASSGSVKYLKEPPPGPVVASLESKVGNVRATLEAEISPEGKAGTEYHFEYVDDAHFKSEGGFASPERTVTPVTALPGPADFELKEHLATAQIGCADPLSEAGHPGKTEIEEGNCLQPETTYHYRVQTSNGDGVGNSPVEGKLETGEYLAIEDTFASEVGTDSARLSARVNPLSIPTTGYFEYVDQATFESSGFAEANKVPNVEESPGELAFGSGEVGVTRSVLVPLEPATTYHFRVVAIDPLLVEPSLGNDASFTTFRAEVPESCPANEAFRSGVATLLPDCRAYEMVSPLDKEGGDIDVLNDSANYPNALTQSSLEGNKLIYGSYRAFGDATAAPLTSQYLATRDDTTGWHSHFILGLRERLNLPVLFGLFNEMIAASPDLCQTWFKTVAEPPLAENAIPKQMNLYRRQDQLCGAQSYHALTTVSPPHGNFGQLEMQGTSADGAKAIYLAGDNLTSDAPNLEGEGLSLYYWEEQAKEPRFVCRLPNGAPITGSCGAGAPIDGLGGRSRTSILTGAISADGERVFWSTPAPTLPGIKLGQLYLRERPGKVQSKVAAGTCTEPTKACTVAVSAKGEELSGTTGSLFWWAAKDGSAALYTTGSTLYEFNVDTRATREIAKKIDGLMGASEDLSRIYFSSEESLPSGPNPEGVEPVVGEANLYLEESGIIHFIGTLGTRDFPPSNYGPVNAEPVKRSSRVSGNGLRAVFTSRAPMTGYANTDAKSPAPCGKASGRCDVEVFFYNAAADGGQGRLVCVSCNPSGSRPAGQLRRAVFTEQFWAAAWLPVWKSSLYPGRVMSDDGSRIYFESSDTLAPRDSNANTDVYQWEEAGSGSCEVADHGYSAQNEGCVSLISTGQSAGAASFFENSPSGDDVFFTTAASLIDEDFGLVDVYDARVGGGLASPPAPTVECEGEGCQSPPPAPLPMPPASLNYAGPEDLKEAAAGKRCPKGRVKKNGRCVRKPKAKRSHRKSRGMRR